MQRRINPPSLSNFSWNLKIPRNIFVNSQSKKMKLVLVLVSLISVSLAATAPVSYCSLPFLCITVQNRCACLEYSLQIKWLPFLQETMSLLLDIGMINHNRYAFHFAFTINKCFTTPVYRDSISILFNCFCNNRNWYYSLSTKCSYVCAIFYHQWFKSINCIDA
jgi:hypothetical protein